MKTNNYSIFKKFPQNRPITERQVDDLIESFRKFGFMKERPIIVDGKMRIIDGQRRLKAAQMMKIDVWYQVISDSFNPDELIIALNKNQQIWRLKEYVHFHATNGSKFYNYLLEFGKKHSLEMSNAIIICADANFESHSKKIRNGFEFNINKNAEKIISFIKFCSDLKFAETVKFVRSVVTLFKKANEKQTNKLLKHRLLITEQPQVLNYLTVFENIINRWNTSDPIKLTK